MARFQFPEWLASLKRQRKGPVYLEPATRGQYWEATISFPGDVRDAELSGQIRAAPDAGAVLAAFNVSSAAYFPGVDRTAWAVSLAAGSGANSTGALPVDSQGDGSIMLPVEFVLQLGGGQRERLFGGVFEVSGCVWEPI